MNQAYNRCLLNKNLFTRQSDGKLAIQPAAVQKTFIYPAVKS